jgi:hypothetical protein
MINQENQEDGNMEKNAQSQINSYVHQWYIYSTY